MRSGSIGSRRRSSRSSPRRLLAESVGLVFAVREPSQRGRAGGASPSRWSAGLSDGDARALLDAIPGRLDAERARPDGRRDAREPARVVGVAPRVDDGRACRRVRASLRAAAGRARSNRASFGSCQSLPARRQRLLLVATAQVVGDVRPARGARLAQLGIGADAAAPAEAVGLIELGDQVRLRHPLVRSAVYRAASLRDRQAVHRALAEATDPDADPDRRAWHRAQAAVRARRGSRRRAGALGRPGRGRGGVAAAAAFLERATELTPDPVRRGARALAAAQAKFEAAAP